jgi:hypothetical protein
MQPVLERGRRRVRWVLVLVLAVLLAGACGDDDEEPAAQPAPATTQPASSPEADRTQGRFACLDFVATVTTGPGTGKSWTGDLVLTPDETGAFTGYLVPVGAANRETLEVDRSRAICRAVGQRNGAQVSWFLYCPNNEIVFGTGQVAYIRGVQELRGILSGPGDRDFGVYHGRNYPPYIRIISGD